MHPLSHIVNGISKYFYHKSHGICFLYMLSMCLLKLITLYLELAVSTLLLIHV